MRKERIQIILGWIAVIIITAAAAFWSFWGIIENFHEGWYFQSFLQNITLMFVQYLLFPLVFMIAAIISIRWNKAGSVLLLIAGVFSIFFFRSFAGIVFIGIPLILLAALFYFSRVENKKIASFLILGIPFAIILSFGTYYGIRVANRFNDNNFGERTIKGNGVELTWAPQGPGWPDNGTAWKEAGVICAHLSADGKSLSDTVVGIWRLPTVDEAVRSMVYHGENAGGVWNGNTKNASYKFRPDKESPLWNIYSKVIYWWTADDINDKYAYIIVYDGGVRMRDKKIRPAYLTFRAVKDVRK